MNMSLTTDIAGDLAERPAARADDFTTSLHELYRELSSFPDLRPGPDVDGAFGRLVRLVLTAPDEIAPAVLADPEVRAVAPRLRALCARGEGELERAWARRIGAAGAPREELARFPYVDNYRQLSRMEIGILASALRRPARSLAFVGAGPLPLSAMLLAGELDVPVDNVDRDPVAVTEGARVASALGYADFRFHQVDVLDADLSGHDVVVLAALVGESAADKRRIMGHLAGSMAPGAILLARSARGLRTLLYPELDLTAFGGFELLTVVHPVNDVVNSAVLARALGGADRTGI